MKQFKMEDSPTPKGGRIFIHSHCLSQLQDPLSLCFYLPILPLIFLIQGLLRIVQRHKKPVDHRHGDVIGAHVDG